jgi:chemotaxis signal transduction protein
MTKLDTANRSSESLERWASDIELQIQEALAPAVPSPVGSEEPSANSGDANHRQYLRFQVNDLNFGIPLSSALEICEFSEVTSLPNLEPWVAGIVNLRGEIVSIVDLQTFFKFGPPASRPLKLMVVIQGNGIKTGLWIDQIKGTLTLRGAQAAVPEDGLDDKAIRPFLSGAHISGSGVCHLLDIDKLVSAFSFPAA